MESPATVAKASSVQTLPASKLTDESPILKIPGKAEATPIIAKKVSFGQMEQSASSHVVSSSVPCSSSSATTDATTSTSDTSSKTTDTSSTSSAASTTTSASQGQTSTESDKPVIDTSKSLVRMPKVQEKKAVKYEQPVKLPEKPPEIPTVIESQQRSIPVSNVQYQPPAQLTTIKDGRIIPGFAREHQPERYVLSRDLTYPYSTEVDVGFKITIAVSNSPNSRIIYQSTGNPIISPSNQRVPSVNTQAAINPMDGQNVVPSTVQKDGPMDQITVVKQTGNITVNEEQTKAAQVIPGQPESSSAGLTGSRFPGPQQSGLANKSPVDTREKEEGGFFSNLFRFFGSPKSPETKPTSATITTPPLQTVVSESNVAQTSKQTTSNLEAGKTKIDSSKDQKSQSTINVSKQQEQPVSKLQTPTSSIKTSGWIYAPFLFMEYIVVRESIFFNL